MPIWLRADGDFVEENVAQKMMRIQNHAGRLIFINKDHPLSPRSIQLTQKWIVSGAFKFWQHRPTTRDWQRNNTAGIDWLPFVQHRDVIYIKKIHSAGCFDFSQLCINGLQMLRHQNTEIPLTKERDRLWSEPPIEQKRGRLGDNEQHHLIKLKKD